MYSFVPHAKMNAKVGLYAWFPLWFINIQRVVIIFMNGNSIYGKYLKTFI